MNPIIYFLKAHKISAHSVAAGLLFLIGAYAAVPAFHDVVMQIATAHPQLAELGTAGIGLFMLYSNSHKEQ